VIGSQGVAGTRLKEGFDVTLGTPYSTLIVVNTYKIRSAFVR
jgi:hypothetical protein